jgi:hypothetical protein
VYQLLWCLSNQLFSSSQQVKLTRHNMLKCYCSEYSAGDVYNQGDNDKEDQHGSGSLIHGMQPSNYDCIHNVSVKTISLR